jgi:Ca2+-transporting ATPase
MSDWHLKKVTEIERELMVEKARGLSAREAKNRLYKYGDNFIPSDKRRSYIAVYLDRFKDLLVLVLLLGALASILLGRYGDAVLIGIVIVIDATLSFTQVLRTENTLRKLREQLQPTAVVLRNGKSQQIDASKLVPGDIIEIRAGERVPADARIFIARSLKVQEAALTGESDDNEKNGLVLNKRTPVSNRRNMLYMGTLVTDGSGMAIVTATGVSSEIGKIAQVLKVSKSPRSLLSRQLNRTGLQIGVGVIVAMVVLVIAGISAGQGWLETIVTAITLIVSAIPEDLTMILTIALTVGVAKILRHKGVVRELSSAETLGSATVICTDKTGTITYGYMTALKIDLLNGKSIDSGSQSDSHWHRLALTGLVLANDAHRAAQGGDQVNYIGTATERAALAFAELGGIRQTDTRSSWRQRDDISFNRQWKYRATLNDHPSQSVRYLFVNGAPETLLAKSNRWITANGDEKEIEAKDRFELEQRIENMAATGKRLLGIAVKRNVIAKEVDQSDVSELLMLGVLVIDDPARKGVAAVIKQAREAGIRIILITGDHFETAKSVARDVGIMKSDDILLTSDDIQKMTDAELTSVLNGTTVIARATPMDKQRVIKALQRQGQVVAMTGDGINDAVALKSADIGVAMGSGKDIAKEAADLVLLDDKFETIVEAIQEGRVLRDNIKKVLAFLLSTNAAEVAIFFVSLVLGMPLPLLPAQILWVNLVTDGTADIALSLEPTERDVMKRKPLNPQARLLNAEMLYHIVVTGVIVTAMTMGLYIYLLQTGQQNLTYIRTMTFTLISFISLLSVWSFRSLKESIRRRGLWGNKWVVVSLLASAGLHLLAIYVPRMQEIFDTVALTVHDWYLIVTLSLIAVVLIDLRKIVRDIVGWWQPIDGAAIRSVDSNEAGTKKWEEGLAVE